MPALAKLVTLTQAKAQLAIMLPAGDPGDTEIQDKLNAAEETILNYVKGARGQAVNWVDPTTAPGPVTEAILVLLTWNYADRGDTDRDFQKSCWPRIEAMLQHYHTPGVA